MTWDEFADKFKMRHNRLLSLTDKSRDMFNGSHSVIEIECYKHGKLKAEGRVILNGMFGCNKCAIEYRNKTMAKTLDEFVMESKSIFGDLLSYEKAEYVNSYTPITLICKKHGDFMILPKDHLNKMECCPTCKLSKLENAVRNKLEKSGIIYISQKKFDWLSNMTLDFYIPSLNLGIECQGKQHFGYGGWDENFDFKALFFRDNRKYHLCKDNGVELAYLSEREYKYDKSLIDFYNDDNLFTDVGDMVKNKITKWKT